MLGVIPIIVKKDFFSCASEDTYRFSSRNFPFKLLLKADSEKPYKLDLSLIKYGGCGLTVMTFGCGGLVCGNLVFLIMQANSRNPRNEGSTPFFRPLCRETNQSRYSNEGG